MVPIRAHARKTIPLAPIHPFTKQMVPSLCPESSTQTLSQSFFTRFRKRPIKCFLSSITFTHTSFYSLFLSFSLYTFSWVCRRSFSNSLFVHSLLCQCSLIFLMDYSQTCVSASPMYALPIILISRVGVVTFKM